MSVSDSLDARPNWTEVFTPNARDAVWPQEIRLGTLFGALFISAVSVGMGAALYISWQSRVYLDIATAGGAVVLFVGCSLGLARSGGIRALSVPRRITSDGRVIRVPSRRVFLLLCVMLGLLAVATLGNAVAFPVGIEEPDAIFLPVDSSEAGFLYGIGGLLFVLGVFFFVIRASYVLEISAAGVRRSSRQWKVVKVVAVDVLVPWDDIVEIVPGGTSPGDQVSMDHPTIRIRTRSVRGKHERIVQDSESDVAVLAHLHVAEPNTLLGLLRDLKENPDRRAFLESPDARKLLRPPPLRERFRAAREKQGAK